MQQTNILILSIVSIIIALILSSCKQEPQDFFFCVLVTQDDQGSVAPLNQWYAYCSNKHLNETKRIPIQDFTKCIDSDGSCKWVLTDVTEYEKAQKEYKDACKK